MKSRRALAAGAFVTVGLLAASTANAAADQSVQVRLTVVVHADGSDTTPVDTMLRIETPVTRPAARKVLTSNRGTAAFRDGLTELLNGLGLYADGDLSSGLISDAEAPPDVSVANGRVTFLFAGSRDLALYVDYAQGDGLWAAKRAGDRVRFTLHAPERVPADVSWTVEAYVAGAQVLRTLPTPDSRTRVAGVPDPPDTQAEPVVPQLASTAGGVSRVAWLVNGKTDPKVGQLAFDLDLGRGSEASIASFTGIWGNLRIAAIYLVASIFFIPLAWFAWRRRGDEHVRRAVVLAWVAIGVWVAFLAGGAATWLVHGGSVDQDTRNVRPGLVAAAAIALLLAAAVRRTWARIALVALAAAAGGAWWAQTETMNAVTTAFMRTSKGLPAGSGISGVVEGSWSAVAVALPVVTAVVLLTWLLLRATPAEKRLTRSWIPVLVVVVVTGLLVGQSATAGYHNWATRHDLAQALNAGQSSGSGSSYASLYLLFFPLSFFGFVGDVLPLVAFAAVLALLFGDSRRGADVLIRRSSPSGFWLTGLMFAAFVAGTGGLVYSWTVPLAFVFALAFWGLLSPRTIETAVENVSADMGVVMALRDQSLRESAEEEAGQQGKTGEQAAEPAPAADARPRPAPSPSPVSVPLAMSLGPGETWWENGCIAMRFGALLSVVPLGYYLYVLFSQRLAHDLSPWNSAGVPDLLRSIVHEVLFWLAAAFVFGAVFPYLPGTRGALKGSALGGFYFAVLGLSVWLLPGNGGDWFFRAFEVFLFLVVLGVIVDWRTLSERKIGAGFLQHYYLLKDVRYVAGYASSATASVVLIVQQLQSGQAHGAISQVIKSLPALIPPLQS